MKNNNMLMLFLCNRTLKFLRNQEHCKSFFVVTVNSGTEFKTASPLSSLRTKTKITLCHIFTPQNDIVANWRVV